MDLSIMPCTCVPRSLILLNVQSGELWNRLAHLREKHLSIV